MNPLFALSAGSLPDTWLALALEVSLKGTAVLLAVVLFATAARRASAASRHLAWGLALYGLLALPLLALILPAWQVPLIPLANSPTTSDARTSETPPKASARPFGLTRPRPGREFTADREGEAPAEPHNTGSAGASPSRKAAALARGAESRVDKPAAAVAPLPWTTWLLIAWAAGVIVTLTPLLVGLAGLRLLARRAQAIKDKSWTALAAEVAARLGLKRRVTLLRCVRGTMPMTWGLVRPVVLLPADADDMSEDRRRLVLLHELAHVQRRDCLTQLLAQVACALYWFHPLVWLAARQLRLERERACDDQVLLSGPRASTYASLLLETARSLRLGRCPSPGAVAMAQRSQLESRLLAILDPSRPRQTLSRKTVGVVLTAAVCLLAPLAALRPWARAADRPAPARSDKAAPSGKQITVAGRVLGPDGKPVAAARVALLTIPRQWWMAQDPEQMRFDLLGVVKADEAGQFQLKVTRIPPALVDLPLLPGQMMVSARGYGYGLHGIQLDMDQKGLVIRLKKEQLLRGRFLDLQGQPVKGLKLRCLAVGEKRKTQMVGVMHPRQGLSFWPGPLVTDAKGRFEMRGVGQGQIAMVRVKDDRFAPQNLELGGDKANPEFKRVLPPAELIEGRITYADTGKPVAGAEVRVQTERVRTDKEGRYRINPPVNPNETSYGGGSLFTLAPEGEPYIGIIQQLEKPKAAAVRRVNVALVRGILVRGKVTKAVSGKPLVGGVVYFQGERMTNPGPKQGYALGPVFTTPTDEQGRFRIAVLPGRGRLLVKGQTPAYVPVVIGDNEINNNQPGGRRHYAHAIVVVDFKKNSGPHEVAIKVQRGVTVRGKILTPDGKPAAGVRMLTRLSTSAPMSIDELRPVAVPGSDFDLKGCDPDRTYPVAFFDEKNGWGALVEVSGKMAGGKPLTVRLARCGKAVARYLSADGKPLEGHRPQIDLVLTPGPHPYDFVTLTKQKVLAADEVALANVHYRSYQWEKDLTDAKGRRTFTLLVPGVTYRIWQFGNDGVKVVRDFKVKAGQTLDLGDIKVK